MVVEAGVGSSVSTAVEVGEAVGELPTAAFTRVGVNPGTGFVVRDGVVPRDAELDFIFAILVLVVPWAVLNFFLEVFV